MTTTKLVNLAIRCSDSNPYSGKLSKKNQVLAAIELAKLFKDFADKGGTDEAINIKSTQWIEVITKLEKKLTNMKKKLLSDVYCECRFAMIRRDQKTQKAYCFECKKEIQEKDERRK